MDDASRDYITGWLRTVELATPLHSHNQSTSGKRKRGRPEDATHLTAPFSLPPTVGIDSLREAVAEKAPRLSLATPSKRRRLAPADEHEGEENEVPDDEDEDEGVQETPRPIRSLLRRPLRQPSPAGQPSSIGQLSSATSSRSHRSGASSPRKKLLALSLKPEDVIRRPLTRGAGGLPPALGEFLSKFQTVSHGVGVIPADQKVCASLFQPRYLPAFRTETSTETNPIDRSP